MGYRQFFIVEHDGGYEVETTLHAAMQLQADFGGRIFSVEGRMVTPGSKIGNDGWIEWKGGRCPVSANDNVGIKFLDGGSYEGPGAHILNWANRGFQSDIIAYRVIENDGREG